MWENCFYIGGHDDGVLPPVDGFTPGAAVCWEFMRTQTVQRMRQLGAEKITAWLGPSICGSCYEVPEALRDQAASIQPSSAGTTSWGTPSIDIPRGLRAQLEQCGVDEVIEIGICTRESDELFSHRRASALGEKAGRFVGIVQTIRDTPSQLP